MSAWATWPSQLRFALQGKSTLSYFNIFVLTYSDALWGLVVWSKAASLDFHVPPSLYPKSSRCIHSTHLDLDHCRSINSLLCVSFLRWYSLKTQRKASRSNPNLPAKLWLFWNTLEMVKVQLGEKFMCFPSRATLRETACFLHLIFLVAGNKQN